MPPRKKALRAKRVDKPTSLRRRDGAKAKADLSQLEREMERVPRSALKRGKPLKRTAIKANGAQLTREQPSKRSVVGGIPSHVRAEVRRRSAGLCEANWEGVCAPGQHRAQHMHHVILRGQGGPDADWNLLHVCLVVHRHAHDVDRAGAERRGIIRRRTTR